VIESRPVEITFDAIQEISGLKIVSSLNAANELSEAAVEIVSWDVQVPARPRPAEIAADIKSRPVVWRCGSGRGRRLYRHLRGLRGDAHANCNNRDASEN
jgi:hypothetical protein